MQRLLVELAFVTADAVVVWIKDISSKEFFFTEGGKQTALFLAFWLTVYTSAELFAIKLI